MLPHSFQSGCAGGPPWRGSDGYAGQARETGSSLARAALRAVRPDDSCSGNAFCGPSMHTMEFALDRPVRRAAAVGGPESTMELDPVAGAKAVLLKPCQGFSAGSTARDRRALATHFFPESRWRRRLANLSPAERRLYLDVLPRVPPRNARQLGWRWQNTSSVKLVERPISTAGANGRTR
jgi:hypothetical protein